MMYSEFISRKISPQLRLLNHFRNVSCECLKHIRNKTQKVEPSCCQRCGPSCLQNGAKEASWKKTFLVKSKRQDWSHLTLLFSESLFFRSIKNDEEKMEKKGGLPREMVFSLNDKLFNNSSLLFILEENVKVKVSQTVLKFDCHRYVFQK